MWLIRTASEKLRTKSTEYPDILSSSSSSNILQKPSFSAAAGAGAAASVGKQTEEKRKVGEEDVFSGFFHGGTIPLSPGAFSTANTLGSVKASFFSEDTLVDFIQDNSSKSTTTTTTNSLMKKTSDFFE